MEMEDIQPKPPDVPAGDAGQTTIDDVMPRLPSGKGYSGKLPDEFVQDWIESKERFIELWNESKSFDMQLPYLVDLGWEEPFFGSLSRRIAKQRTAAIPTAAVRVIDNSIEMLWNPIFFSKVLETRQVTGVIKHELYHVILEHLTQRRQTPNTLWNAAADCAINCLIPRRELPDFVLLPGELYRPPKAKPDWKPGLLARIIRDAPKDMSAEWYMSHFLNDEEIQQAMSRARATARERMKQDGGQAPCPNPGQGGQGQLGPNGQPSQQPNAGDQQRREEREFNSALEDELYGDGSCQFDDHDVWDQLSDEQRDMMRDAIRDMFRDCIREAEQRSNGWGTVPQGIQAHLKKLISKEVDWRDLINQFIGRSRSTKTTSSIKRINRRYPWEHPGRKRAYSATPAIAFDQSGSMSDHWVQLLFAEICNLGNLTDYDVIPFDWDVDEKTIQHIRRGGQPKIIRTKQGGTNFNAPIEYVNKKVKSGVQYDCLFILTDGGCFSPVKCDIPLAYILAPGCELMFKPPEGVPVIRMTDARKK